MKFSDYFNFENKNKWLTILTFGLLLLISVLIVGIVLFLPDNGGDWEEADNSYIEPDDNNTVMDDYFQDDSSLDTVDGDFEFSKAKEKWSDIYSKAYSESDIPTDKYLALYFRDTPTGKVFVTKNLVNEPKISYSYSEFENINAEDLSVLFLTKKTYSEDLIKEVHSTDSWLYARVIIDGDEVIKHRRFKSNRDNISYTGAVKYRFEKDKEYLVEIEMENDWHTIDYTAKILNPIKKTSVEDLKSELNINDSDEVFYVGVYEGGKNLEVDLKLENTNKYRDDSIILLLNSYESIDWRFIGEAEKIKAIVFNSYYQNSTFRSQGFQGSVYYLDTNLGSVYERDAEFVKAADEWSQILGKRPTAFVGDYNPEELVLLGKKLTNKDYNSIKNSTPSSSPDSNQDCVRVGGDLICGGDGDDLIIG